MQHDVSVVQAKVEFVGHLARQYETSTRTKLRRTGEQEAISAFHLWRTLWAALTMDFGLPVVPDENTIQIGWLKSPRKKGIVALLLSPNFMKLDQLRIVGPAAKPVKEDAEGSLSFARCPMTTT